MTHHILSQAALLICLSLANGAQAAGEIVKCTNETGSTTYTNLPCERDADAARGLASNNSAAIKEETRPPARIYGASWETREGNAVKLRIGKHKTPLDTDTVKEARSSTLLMDKASAYLRQQNMVALDIRNPGWFDFR
jgi:hypothetical protein